MSLFLRWIIFFEKGAVGQKRLGTCGLHNRLRDGGKVVGLRSLRTLLPRNIIFMFLVLISVRG
jgi:hypothetical protein